MARADLLTDLVKFGITGDKNRFRKVAEAIIAEERAKKHTVLADKLEELLQSSDLHPKAVTNGNGVSSLSTYKVDQFLHEITPQKRLDELVLPPDVQKICRGLIEEHHRTELLRSYNLEPRNRILLIGPPGNGKTSIAEAIAEAMMIPLLAVRYEGVVGAYGSRDAYLEADPTIEAKAKDMVKHYLTHVFPNGYKAQIVATSREAAVRYKKHIDAAISAAITELERSNPNSLNIDQLRKMQTDVIISGGHSDLPHLKQYSNESQHETSIKSFKVGFGAEDEEENITGDMGILIVNNMLITGFDAPVEQVMYLDKVTTDHNLLQAIARVNRVRMYVRNI